MKTAIGVLILAMLATPAFATTYYPIQGWCQDGGELIVLQGMYSVNPAQGSHPGCQVAVFETGTINLSTIYRDSIGTPLTNPFITNTVNGQWIFFVPAGDAVDVTTTGGTPPLPAPVTITNIVPIAGTTNGAGTANTLPKWVASQTLGNSSVTDSGTEVSIPTSLASCRTNGVRLVDAANTCGWAGSDVGQWINAAVAELPATGGVVYVPAGSFNFSHTINLNAGIILQCAASGTNDFPTSSPWYGTNLVWTGTGGTAISISGPNVNAQVRDCALDNTGTGAIGIDMGGLSNTIIVDNVWIFPVVPFSTAGIQVGITSESDNVTISNSYVRNNAHNLILGTGSGFTSFNTRWLGATTTPDIQIGGPGFNYVDIVFDASDIEPDENAAGGTTDDIDGVLLLQATSVKFVGTTFELAQSTTTPTTGLAVSIPASATDVHGVSISDSRIAGPGNANTSYGVSINKSASDLSISNTVFTFFNNPSFAINAQSALRITFNGNQMQATGMTIAQGNACVQAWSNANGSGLLPDQNCTNIAVIPGQHYGSSLTNKDVANTCILGTSCVVTFLTPYSSTPVCLANDLTSANPVRVTSISTNGVTFTGTGTDTLNYLCFGNPN